LRLFLFGKDEYLLAGQAEREICEEEGRKLSPPISAPQGAQGTQRHSDGIPAHYSAKRKERKWRMYDDISGEERKKEKER